MKYEEPVIEIFELEQFDIIRTSTGTGKSGNDPQVEGANGPGPLF